MNSDEVLISDPGDLNPRRLPVVGVQCSWELSNVGSFSAFARVEDLQRIGLADTLTGKWLTYDHATLGRWGGVCLEPPVSDGVAEIAAEGWVVLLRGRSLLQWIEPAAAPPAGLARRAIMEATSSDPLWVTFGLIEESGEPVLETLGAQDVLDDVLPKLADEGGMDWLVDADRVFHAGRLGADRSASVRFHEGREIVDANIGTKPKRPEFIETFRLLTAEFQAIIQGGSPATAGHIVPGQRRWYRPAIESYVIEPYAVATGTAVDLRPNTALPTVPMELTLADVNDAWAQCELGTTIRVVIGSHPFGSGVFRILGLAYDATSNELVVAGDGLSDTEAA